MKQIPLHGKNGDGLFALVDDSDFDFLNQYRWSLKPCYGRRANLRYCHARVNGVTTMMHRLLMGPVPPGHVGDHKNGEGIDNQRHNLRFCTRAVNMVNYHKASGWKSSNHPGVSWDKHNQKWHAQIKSGAKNHHLGFFNVESDAAKAYQLALVNVYGENVRKSCSTSSIA